MTCFQRNGLTRVPGCKKKNLWVQDGTADWDYCVEPMPLKKNVWLEIQSESKPTFAITSNAAHEVLMTTAATDFKIVTGLYKGTDDYVSLVDTDGRYIHKSSKGYTLVSSFMMDGASAGWRKKATFRVTHGISTTPGTLSFESVWQKNWFIEVKGSKLDLSWDFGKFTKSTTTSFKLVDNAAIALAICEATRDEDCADWTCTEWCACYDDTKDQVYADAGCADGEDSCLCY